TNAMQETTPSIRYATNRNQKPAYATPPQLALAETIGAGGIGASDTGDRDGSGVVATKAGTAWPHVEQNAVVGEISLPHFEQYTASPYLRECPSSMPMARILLPHVTLVNYNSIGDHKVMRGRLTCQFGGEARPNRPC
ncbi:MAG: hypothetical protein WCE50_14530, partial [Candidatus Acidiferrum sp.]